MDFNERTKSPFNSHSTEDDAQLNSTGLSISVTSGFNLKGASPLPKAAP
jgi:hypothetical protein